MCVKYKYERVAKYDMRRRGTFEEYNYAHMQESQKVKYKNVLKICSLISQYNVALK